MFIRLTAYTAIGICSALFASNIALAKTPMITGNVVICSMAPPLAGSFNCANNQCVMKPNKSNPSNTMVEIVNVKNMKITQATLIWDQEDTSLGCMAAKVQGPKTGFYVKIPADYFSVSQGNASILPEGSIYNNNIALCGRARQSTVFANGKPDIWRPYFIAGISRAVNGTYSNYCSY